MVPFALRKSIAVRRWIPRESRSDSGNDESSAPVSTSTPRRIRRSPGRIGFSISTSVRKVPISSDILTPSCSPPDSPYEEYASEGAGLVDDPSPHHEHDAPHHADILQWISCDRDQVGVESGCDGAETVTEPE